ncbi:MAG: mechanosensitive ion channel family protein [Croceibacterium sp.]
MATPRTPVFAWLTANLTDITLALVIAVGIFVLLYALRALILRATKKLGPSHSLTDVLGNVVRKTRMWFIAALSIELVQGYLHPPSDIGSTITFLFTIAAALQAAIWARTLILGMIARRAGEHDGDAASLASAMGIIKLLVSVAVFAIAAIVVLDNLGVNVTGLIAGLGVGGIAIGLAAQGIFSDLFAALSIIFDKPFRVGDMITFAGKEGPVSGHVVKIGLKSTRIRALTGELRIIGNTQLLAQEVSNFAGRQVYRHRIAVGVIYQTDPEVAAEVPHLMQVEAERAGHRFVRGSFIGFGPSSLDFEMLFEVDSGDVSEAMLALQTVALGILRSFNQRDIEFAYPTQTTFTSAPDGTMIMPYPQVMPVVTKN